MSKNPRKKEEKELADKVLARLEKHFDIVKRECYGEYIFTDKARPRIDAIIKPKDTSEWKNKDVYFGIEFKKPNISTKNITEMFCQAYQYSMAIFDKYGSIPVLLCPPLDHHMKGHRYEDSYFFLSRILGKQLIGEIKNHPHYGVSLWMNGSHRIWSERNGVELEGKRCNFIRGIGAQKFQLKNKDEEE